MKQATGRFGNEESRWRGHNEQQATGEDRQCTRFALSVPQGRTTFVLIHFRCGKVQETGPGESGSQP